ncbi:MAG: phenylacetate--CoA ligase family protein [Balneolaceae bacterium]|nr:MAG: phenylacetate--CoA ligase family protein [Balneolaceae bacterium]
MAKKKTEKLYHRLPYPLQNISVSLYGLKLRRQRYGGIFQTSLESLKRSEWQSRKEILHYQNENVVRIINHAYETVPFYKKWYDEYGVNVKQIQSIEDLKQLPVLKKEHIVRNPDQFISTLYNKNKLISTLTSGTTGTPLKVYQTKESIHFQWAVFWRARARFGLNIHDRQLMFGARIPMSQVHQNPPYWRHDYFNNRVYISTNHISEKTVLPIIDYLNSNHFDFFAGYPSAIFQLARLIREMDQRIYNRPKIIVFGSDAVSTHQSELIGKVFGAPVTEFYGMVEFAGTMAQCEKKCFHVDHEHCYIEHKQIDNSESHKLILTGWGNRAMPFIRYDVGDYGTPVDSNCTCGRESPVFSSIDGRMEDFITTPDGRKLTGMNQVLKYATNVLEIQLQQKNIHEVEFNIVPDKSFDEHDKMPLITEFRKRTGDHIRIKFNIVKEIEKSAKGKFKAVISDLD